MRVGRVIDVGLVVLALAFCAYTVAVMRCTREPEAAAETWPASETQACVNWGNACSATIRCCAGAGSCMVVAGGKRKCCFAVSQGFCQ